MRGRCRKVPPVKSCHTFDLSNAAACQLGCFGNAHPCIPKSDNTTVMRQIRLSPCVATCPLCKLDPFALPLTTSFVVIASSLKRNTQEHILYRFQHDPRYTQTLLD